jgi:acetyltransferase
MTTARVSPIVSPSIRPPTPHDREQLAGFLAGLSEESAYQRFLTGGGGRPTSALLDGLLPEGPNAGALLGFVDGQLVAHALWVAPPTSDVAELAIVVADRHQRQGLGTALALVLAGELSARGIQRAEALTAADNRAVARMIARLAPTAIHERDGATLTYSFPTPVNPSAGERFGHRGDAPFDLGVRRGERRQAQPQAAGVAVVGDHVAPPQRDSDLAHPRVLERDVPAAPVRVAG